jgi:phage/plasmid-associated DNA primase
MIEFELQSKFHLACNDKPKVNSNDGGTWRRLIVINFLSKFVTNPEKPNQYRMDLTIEQKVKSELWGRAFLAQLIDIYKNTSHMELTPPDVVLEYTSEYREENDAITKFVRETLRVPTDDETILPVRRETLTEAFKQWWESNRGTRDWKIPEMHRYVENTFGKYTHGGWKTFQLQQEE